MGGMTLEQTLEAQRTASDPSRSVWVNANAGTGKTKVLTDRVLRLLLAGTSADAILCITFTNNAAAEMHQRLLSRSREWVHCSDEALHESLTDITGEIPSTQQCAKARTLYYELIDKPHALHFTTLHGFCQELLQRFPLEAGLVPHFTVLEDGQSKALLREAAQQLFRQAGRHKSQAASQALQVLAETLHDDGLQQVLREMVGSRHMLREAFSREKGMEETHAAIDHVCGIAALPEDPWQALELSFDSFEVALREIMASLAEGGKTEQKASLVIADWLEAKTEQAFAALRAVLLTKEGKPKRMLGKKSAEAYPHHLQTLERIQLCVAEYDEHVKALNLARMSHAYVTLAEEVDALYSQRKRVRNALDFDDLISHASRLLERSEQVPWILYRMDRRITHILLDEAQDTSPQQWAIVHALCEEYISQSPEKTVFVVGDTKQSIYSFQGARPAQLAEQKQRLEQYVQAQEATLTEVAMQQSFRSVRAVLSFVDTLFDTDERRHALQYTQQAVAHGVYRDKANEKNGWGRVECWPLIVKEKTEEPEPFSLPLQYEVEESAAKNMADAITSRIKTWLTEKTELPNHGRPISAGDILVLVRNRRPLVEPLARELKRAGIPVAGTDRLVLQEHLMVQDLLALAQWCLLPQDDYSLACVLKSPLFCMDEETLFACAHGRNASLWEVLQSKAPEEMVERLSQARAWADGEAPDRFFHQLCASWQVEKSYSAFYGAEAGEILRLFLACTESAAQGEHPTLTGFVPAFLEARQEVKQQADSERDEVRIMTVHGAKGLQAPIVILPDNAVTKSKAPNVFHVGDAVLYGPNDTCHATPFRMAKDAAKQAEEEEQARLLYVAATRAEDWLIVGGFTHHQKASSESWYQWMRDALESQGAKEDEQGVLSIETGEVLHVEDEHQASPARPELPAWALQEVQPFKSEPFYAPSRLTEGEAQPKNSGSSSAERGNRIHALLEQFVPLSPAKRTLENAQALLAEDSIETEYAEVMQLLEMPEVAKLFEHSVQLEVPVIGQVNHEGKSLSIHGSIDCLVYEGDTITILDFKSGTPHTDAMLDAYRVQLLCYQELMEKAYPSQKVRAGLLWTQTGDFSWLEPVENMPVSLATC